MIHLYDKHYPVIKTHAFLRILALWEISHGITLSEKVHKTIFTRHHPRFVVVKENTPTMLAVVEL